MFGKIVLNGLKANLNGVIFGGDIFVDSYKKNSKSSPFSTKIVGAIYDGTVTGMITDLDFWRVRRILGERGLRKMFYERMSENPECSFYEILLADDLDKYEKIPAYKKLFELSDHSNLDKPDLTSAITAIENDIPFVTNDHYRWNQLPNITGAYRERHAEERARQIIGKQKTSDLLMYDSSDFCKLVLHL